ncbi:helix-turn-helix domain-containing protein [Natranaeroarchaeum aerophilus]|uniref:Helix-turn-helix domain-containing protein n=1 Tax=Natranaeroarchaeum aerophilus TaxID=2917711 RepID=A0AAE3FU02_9EURY|nr:helix-turn-helix domain-containing protein [Natranaeroarchaeum aerophilus]MCL9814940.1 helix-turn-helix domain-containing protein [Natranaeroarchaeum aerophilus]
MGTRHGRATGEPPDDPSELLPETSILSLDEYLEMQAAIGNRTRFEIVYRLVRADELTPTELDSKMDLDDSTLHYHLGKLQDVGLIEKRVRTERDSDGLYTYYRSTVLGEAILEHGVEELLRREWDFTDAYDSTT